MDGLGKDFPKRHLTLYCFDLDGTLAESKKEVHPLMKKELSMLLKKGTVAVFSGAGLHQFLVQLLTGLSMPVKSSIYIVPTNGSACYHINGLGQHTRKWKLDFGFLEKVHIGGQLVNAIKAALGEFPKPHSDPFEDRDGQITWSALGQNAPLEEKKKWDPDKTKRLKIVRILRESFKGQYQVSLGGTTSIDITMKGVDKASALEILMEHLKPSKVYYVGDDLGPGGNDECIKRVPFVECKEVSGPSETLGLIMRWNDEKGSITKE